MARGSVAEEVSGVDGEEAPSHPSSVWSTASLHSAWGALTQAQCQRRGHKPDLSTVHDPATSTLSHFCLFVELLKSIVNIVCGDLGKQRKVMGFHWWLSW